MGVKIILLVICNCTFVLFQGLFARRRQLILTDAPHLYYVDPVAMELKGEIPWYACNWSTKSLTSSCFLYQVILFEDRNEKF